MTPKEILEELDNNKMDLSSLVEEVKENRTKSEGEKRWAGLIQRKRCRQVDY